MTPVNQPQRASSVTSGIQSQRASKVHDAWALAAAALFYLCVSIAVLWKQLQSIDTGGFDNSDFFGNTWVLFWVVACPILVP